MSTPLIKTPPIYSLPFSKGGDLVVAFRNKVPGSNPAVYQDYPDGVAVRLVIDTDTPITATATIEGEYATVRVESEVADTVVAKKFWRCIYQAPGSPTTEIVVTNGLTDRYDGKPKS